MLPTALRHVKPLWNVAVACASIFLLPQTSGSMPLKIQTKEMSAIRILGKLKQKFQKKTWEIDWICWFTSSNLVFQCLCVDSKAKDPFEKILMPYDTGFGTRIISDASTASGGSNLCREGSNECLKTPTVDWWTNSSCPQKEFSPMGSIMTTPIGFGGQSYTT